MREKRLIDWYIIILGSLAIFGFLLLLDYWLPAKETREIVIASRSYFQQHKSGSGHEVYGIVTNKEQIPCPEALYGSVEKNDTVVVAKTPMTGAIWSIGYKDRIYSGFYSIYNAYCLFPTLLFLSAAIGFALRLRRKDYFIHAFALALILGVYLAIAIITNRII